MLIKLCILVLLDLRKPSDENTKYLYMIQGLREPIWVSDTNKTILRVWIGDQFGLKTKNGGVVVKCLVV